MKKLLVACMATIFALSALAFAGCRLKDDAIDNPITGLTVAVEKERLDEMVKSGVVSGTNIGTFCSLEIAYESGLLTGYDIMHVMHFYRGVVYKIDESVGGNLNDEDTWETVEFSPNKVTPVLDLDIKAEIIASWCIAAKKSAWEDRLVDFFGEYNGSYVVRIFPDNEFSDVLIPKQVGNFAYQYSGPDFVVWNKKI